MDLRKSIETLVDELVDAGKTFTAFDVTTELRANNPTEDTID